MKNINPMLLGDSYKQSHRPQYPENTTLVYSNLTPRSTKFAPIVEGVSNKITFFGLQYFLKECLVERFNEDFFLRDQEDVVGEYKKIMNAHLGNDGVGEKQIRDLHNLGYLPICIRALPEGIAVNERVPVLTIHNTLQEFFWLTNYLETILSCYTWKPSTSATTARKYKEILTRFARETHGDVSIADIQGHDFSFRGMSFVDDAAMSGAGHLTSFIGTDTIVAIPFIEKYYNSKVGQDFLALSVPASEHSCMCLGADYSGEEPDELENFRRFITELYPSGIVSIVSDSFNYWGVLTKIISQLKQEILNRSGGVPFDRVVLRPDSSDPVECITGKALWIDNFSQKNLCDALNLGFTHVETEFGFFEIYDRMSYSARIDYKKYEPKDEEEVAELRGTIRTLWNIFGGTTSEKGYKILHSSIGMIYGDSITLERCYKICQRLKAQGFASTNVVIGIGSYTYEYTTRDTYGFAVKATAGIVNGEEKMIYKDPKTDKAKTKKSARGFLAVRKDENGEYILVDELSFEKSQQNTELTKVFEDGKLLVDHKFSEIRERVAASII